MFSNPTISTILETQAATAMSIVHDEPPQNYSPCLLVRLENHSTFFGPGPPQFHQFLPSLKTRQSGRCREWLQFNIYSSGKKIPLYPHYS